ncbi:MAG: AMP-binding protein [Muribaculaceae bacterium]|nr:AMP-binding protein [Muribaculaceae bacterium]
MTYEELQTLWTGGTPEIETRTSGSTGAPKSIRLPRALVRDSAWRTIRAFNLSRDSWLHSCLSPETIGGKMQCIRALELGARFTHEPPSNTPLDWFGPRDWLSMVSVVPSQVPHILDRLEQGTLPLMEILLIGGAPLPEGVRKRLADSPIEAWESYGMTECASHIALRRVTSDEGLFRPLPGVEVSLTEKGCLCINLPGVPPMITNDLAEITPGGFKILGRADNVIISGGRKIIPEEIESLLSLPATECAVTSLPDDKWGERVVVAVTSEEAHDGAARAISGIEPHWKRPKEILTVTAIPLTPNGKIDRKALKTEALKAGATTSCPSQ